MVMLHGVRYMLGPDLQKVCRVYRSSAGDS